MKAAVYLGVVDCVTSAAFDDVDEHFHFLMKAVQESQIVRILEVLNHPGQPPAVGLFWMRSDSYMEVDELGWSPTVVEDCAKFREAADGGHHMEHKNLQQKYELMFPKFNILTGQEKR